MSEEEVSIDQIKKIFANATGEKKIEVTEGEFDALLGEAQKKKLKIIKGDDSFSLLLENLTIKIVCEDEEDDFEDDENF